jgi:hypothetical protein
MLFMHPPLAVDPKILRPGRKKVKQNAAYESGQSGEWINRRSEPEQAGKQA